MSDYELHHGDCLDILPTLAPQSVDAVICDPPYGTTACKWDSVIPFNDFVRTNGRVEYKRDFLYRLLLDGHRPIDALAAWNDASPQAGMWEQLKRIIKPRGAIVLFGSQPFTSALVMSNPQMFRYDWTWYKNGVTGIALAEYQPMRCKEDILVFGQGQLTFNKQLVRSRITDRKLGGSNGIRGSGSNHYSFAKGGEEIMLKEWVNPRNVLEFPIESMAKGRLHPTQKPLALLEYLVKTYTNAGDLVLDFAFGSGTTGAACGNLGRRFVGMEKDAGYFAAGAERIATAYAPLRMMGAI